MSQEHKDLLFGQDAREKLLEGIQELSKIVSVTLGPRGSTIGLDSSYGPPKVTSQSGDIVDDIAVKDTYVNMGIDLGKELAAKIKQTCGDGTTTAIILLEALVSAGYKNIATGTSPIFVKRGMEKALEEALKALKKISMKVEGDLDIEAIATVAASGNQEIGKMIAEGLSKIGSSGVITIEEGKKAHTTLETVDGMRLDRGYVSPYFSTNQEKMIAEMASPKILITDKKITSIQEILPILQEVNTTGSPLLIIADDIEGDALSTLVVNKLRGTLNVCAIKAPGFGDRKKAYLDDIAILTGATVVSEEVGLSLSTATSGILGSAEKIDVTKDHTTILSSNNDEAALKARVKELDAMIQAAPNDYDREKLEERRAKLVSGVAVIRVGAPTEPEMTQTKRLFEDSLSATKAALDEGICPGGGCAFLQVSKELEKLEFTKDDQLGAKILIKALKKPFLQIVKSSGEEPSLILKQVEDSKGTLGFNVLKHEVEDLFKAKVVDPTKVLTTALSLAVSTAGIVLLSEVLVKDSDEPQTI